MQTFLQKINKNRKIILSILFIFLFPSITFAFVGESILKNSVAWVFDTLRGLAAAIFYFSGMIFDNLLQISLSTSLFNTDFIRVAWSNIRDIANIGFILGAIYIAFSMMANHGNWKKSLISLIVVIFVINFSLFFSRVIVDAGNITARVFLTSISVNIDNTENYFAAARAFYPEGSTDRDFKSVGAAFISGLSPEGLLGIETFKEWQEDARNKGDEGQNGLGTYILLQVILIWFFIAFAKHMFVGGFMFLGRLVHITFYMISAPAFFITAFIPGQENLWKNRWLIPLIEKSFCIVIYLFFLWLSLIILNADLVRQVQTGDFFGTLGIFIIKALFIVKMLSMGNDLGKKFCEDGKSTLTGVLGAAGSVIGGIAKYTPVGMVTRTVVGRTGRYLQKKDGFFAQKRESNSLAGRLVGVGGLAAGEKLRNLKVNGQTYDGYNQEYTKLRNEGRTRMSKEGQKNAQLRDYDIKTNNSGAIKDINKATNKVKGFVDAKKNEEWKEANVSYTEETLSEPEKKEYKEIKIDSEKEIYLAEKQAAAKSKAEKEGNREGYDIAEAEWENTQKNIRTEMVEEAHKSDKGLVNSVTMKDGQQSFANEKIGNFVSFMAGEEAAATSEANTREKEQEKNIKAKKKKDAQVKAAVEIESKDQEMNNKIQGVEKGFKDGDVAKLEISLQSILDEATSKDIELQKADSGLVDELTNIKEKIGELVVIEKEEERVENMKMFEDGDYKYSDVKDSQSGKDFELSMQKHFGGETNQYKSFMQDMLMNNVDKATIKEARNSQSGEIKIKRDTILGEGKTITGVLNKTGAAVKATRKANFNFQKATDTVGEQTASTGQAKLKAADVTGAMSGEETGGAAEASVITEREGGNI